MSSLEIQPVRPIAPYLGGKKNLARRICAIIDRDAHETYAEPFVGMGGIFLRRTRRARSEFINDRGREVYTLFRMLQEHYVAFLDLLRFQITTQANFERLVGIDPETLTDLSALHASSTSSAWPSEQGQRPQLRGDGRSPGPIQSNHTGTRPGGPA